MLDRGAGDIHDIRVGDIIEGYEQVEVKRK